jgi:hypothetical protein
MLVTNVVDKVPHGSLGCDDLREPVDIEQVGSSVVVTDHDTVRVRQEVHIRHDETQRCQNRRVAFR